MEYFTELLEGSRTRIKRKEEKETEKEAEIVEKEEGGEEKEEEITDEEIINQLRELKKRKRQEKMG